MQFDFSRHPQSIKHQQAAWAKPSHGQIYRLQLLNFLLLQCLGIRMHAGELLGDRRLLAVLQDPPAL